MLSALTSRCQPRFTVLPYVWLRTIQTTTFTTASLNVEGTNNTGVKAAKKNKGVIPIVYKKRRPVPSPISHVSGLPVPKLKQKASDLNKEIHLAAMSNYWYKGLEVFEEMRQTGIPIQPNTYVVLSRNCLAAKQYDSVLDLFEYYKIEQHPPNADLNQIVKVAQSEKMRPVDEKKGTVEWAMEVLSKQMEEAKVTAAKNVQEKGASQSSEGKKEKKKKKKEKNVILDNE